MKRSTVIVALTLLKRISKDNPDVLKIIYTSDVPSFDVSLVDDLIHDFRRNSVQLDLSSMFTTLDNVSPNKLDKRLRWLCRVMDDVRLYLKSLGMDVYYDDTTPGYPYCVVRRVKDGESMLEIFKSPIISARILHYLCFGYTLETGFDLIGEPDPRDYDETWKEFRRTYGKKYPSDIYDF